MRPLRIGYSPNSASLTHPADRRRIVYWAKERGHEIVLDLEANYDVLVLSERADLTRYSSERKQSPVIIDLVDGYLGHEDLWRDWLRGCGKVLTGQNSGTPRPYRKIVGEACQLAQAVVCETLEQRETILPYCRNTHAILDFHEEFPMLPFSAKSEIRNYPALLWEGLPFTAKGLLLLEEAFSEILKTKSISLEMVTDLNYPAFLGKYFYQPTNKIIGEIPTKLGENFNLTKWTLEHVVEAAMRSHISVLPLDPHGTLNPLKAENRLLMMWRLGLPVVASPSLAYSRVMREIGINGICQDPNEWLIKISTLMDSIELRKESVEKGQQYIRDTHSKEKVLTAWDTLFESVL
jgi:glycosyltransferase involved in cell wall biosynthesis